MSSRFFHAPGQPFHLSVGALLVDTEGRICVHRMSKANTPHESMHKLGGLSEAYILMRETIEDNEPLEDALARGLREEFGTEGILKKYLGSVQCSVPEDGDFEKTTLYFEVSLSKQSERPSNDAESYTDIRWIEPHELLEAMREQGRHADRGDLDESKIVAAHLALKSS